MKPLLDPWLIAAIVALFIVAALADIHTIRPRGDVADNDHGRTPALQRL
jgi:hypothetical protein